MGPSWSWRTYMRRSQAHRPPRRKGIRSDVQLLHFTRAFHDELEPRRDVLAEQVVDHLVRLRLGFGGDRDAQADALLGIERGALQLVRGHLAQSLEPHDLRLGVALHALPED